MFNFSNKKLIFSTVLLLCITGIFAGYLFSKFFDPFKLNPFEFISPTLISSVPGLIFGISLSFLIKNYSKTQFSFLFLSFASYIIFFIALKSCVAAEFGKPDVWYFKHIPFVIPGLLGGLLLSVALPFFYFIQLNILITSVIGMIAGILFFGITSIIDDINWGSLAEYKQGIGMMVAFSFWNVCMGLGIVTQQKQIF